MNKNRRYIDYGIEVAKEHAMSDGLIIGQTVSHESDPITYSLIETRGSTAIVWVPGQADTIKEFPLDELFDPHVVMRIAMERKVNEIQKAVKEKLPHLN